MANVFCAVINDKTKLIWAETPTNPLLKIIDIAALAALVEKHKCLLGVDSMLRQPFLAEPNGPGR